MRYGAMVLLLVGSLFVCTDAAAQTVLGVSSGLYLEDGRLHAKQKMGDQEEQDQSYDFRPDNFLSGSLWFLLQLSPRLRVGSDLEYMGTYASLTRPTEQQRQQPNFEPRRFEFGRLLEFYGRFEFLVPALPNVDLILGAAVGMPFLFPRGDLKNDIEDLQDRGAAVWKVPRTGYLVGPMLSGRWKYDEHLYLRSDLQMKWEQIFVYRTSGGLDDGTSFTRRWTTGSLRYQVNFAIEVLL